MRRYTERAFQRLVSASKAAKFRAWGGSVDRIIARMHMQAYRMWGW